MTKRTEFLLVSLVLSGAAIAAALTSNNGLEHRETAAVAEPAGVSDTPAVPAEAATTIETETAPAEPESRGKPVVSYMDLPADELSDS